MAYITKMMSPSPSDSDDDLDSGVPEAVTRSQSIAESKRQAAALQAADAELRRKRKEKNRIQDENLKRRAAETWNAGEPSEGASRADNVGMEVGSSGEDNVVAEENTSTMLEDRMARAMREAEQESEGGSEEDEEWGGLGDDVDMTDGSEGSESAGSSPPPVDLSGKPSKGKAKAVDYLPDHLFREALSKAHPSVRKHSEKSKAPQAQGAKTKRKKRKVRTNKDVILGTKTVRLTGENRENPVMKAASRTVPPGKVRRFAETRLHLRSDKRSSSWQRKPSNIGVLRSSYQPAAGFVRSR